MTCEHVEREIEAYLDGELDRESVAAMRGHIEGCARCLERVSERESLGRLLRTAPYHAAPDRLRARVAAAAGRAAWQRRLLTWTAAAALVVVSVGGAAAGVALLRSRPGQAPLIADQVVDGHVRSLMADHLFDVRSTDQHTVKPWFLGRLDFAPPVTDLAPIGFPLVGGRLDYLGGQPVAALVYQRRQHTINVFVSPGRDGDDTSPAVRSIRGFHVHHWTRDGMSYWAVSDVNDAELSEFVRALQAG